MLLFLVPVAAEAEVRAISITARTAEPASLPAETVLEVQLLDVSRADAPSAAISSRRLEMASLPTTVELPYDGSKIDGRMSYVIAARLLSGGKILFRTTRSYPVLTRGGDETAEVVLEPMAATTSGMVAQQRIAGVPWAATEIAGRALIMKDLPTIAFLEDGSFALFSGCNRFRGKAEIAEGRIAFPSPLAGTRRACPPGQAKLEQDILDSLQESVGYWRTGSRLSFVNEAGAVTVRFQERPE